MEALVTNNSGMLNVFMPYDRNLYWFQAFEDQRNVGMSGNQLHLRHPLRVDVDERDAYDFITIVVQMSVSGSSETYKRRRNEAIACAEKMFLPYWDSVMINGVR